MNPETVDLLRAVCIKLPRCGMAEELMRFLGVFGALDRRSISFNKTAADFLPNISLRIDDRQVPEAEFVADSGIAVIELTNTTGQTKESPHSYIPISLEDTVQRISAFDLGCLDHVGFDLPWFDGVHPEVLKLRNLLKNKCAYYRSFTGESWDFILPATETEIDQNDIDLQITRRPKFEIVSIDKVSTPIVQCDFSVHAKFEQLTQLFPEAIHDPQLRNVWVYLESPYDIDICLVIGEVLHADWSHLFKDFRLRN